ncbi:MAG: 2-C-methyl-D-erythritol 4-phosphate cytidylyltransferase [Eubacteriales bacterium]
MKKKHKISAICLAGGSGKRMGSSTPKVLMQINNTPAILYSLKAFQSSEKVDEIVLVCPKGQAGEYENIASQYKIEKLTKITEGGEERTHSVYNGLCVLEGCDYVMIHDGARPMLTQQSIDILLDQCIAKGSAIAAKPVVNTLKQTAETKILKTVDRSDIWEVYTPQCFEYSLIKKAYDYVIENDISITDDASAMEAICEDVFVCEIVQRDFKLTNPSDVELVEKLLMKKCNIKMGLGFDVHRFAKNRKLILGGVEIPYHLGLLGHSDADVLTHAVMDGILGAAGLPDIGQLFPDSADEFKGIYSINLLEKVIEKTESLGYRINNIDAVIACETPKIAPYREKMIECLSGALHCGKDRVNIKGTTTEKMGFEGRGEGISARCIVSLIQYEN